MERYVDDCFVTKIEQIQEVCGTFPLRNTYIDRTQQVRILHFPVPRFCAFSSFYLYQHLPSMFVCGRLIIGQTERVVHDLLARDQVQNEWRSNSDPYLGHSIGPLS